MKKLAVMCLVILLSFSLVACTFNVTLGSESQMESSSYNSLTTSNSLPNNVWQSNGFSAGNSNGFPSNNSAYSNSWNFSNGSSSVNSSINNSVVFSASTSSNSSISSPSTENSTSSGNTNNQTPAISAELEALLSKVSNDWNGDSYLQIKQDAFDRLINYYNNPGAVGGGAGELNYAPNTTLRMAVGYNNPRTSISFNPELAGSGITLADGKTYNIGDLKPTWAEIENRLNVNLVDMWTGAGSAEKEFTVWADRLDEVDMVAGSQAKLQQAGVEGKLINLADHLNKMPNFKAFLDANPIIRLSITGSTTGSSKGAIYFSPYINGMDYVLERVPLMRTDFVEKLLNGEGQFTATSSKNLSSAYYTPYMPTSGKVAVQVLRKNMALVPETINKDYDAAGNIIANMNAALERGTVTGVEAVNMLRDYIDVAYNGFYGNNRADLFIGQNAAWDADELVALLRCVVANSYTLNGTDTIYGLFSREDGNTQRRVDLVRFAGMLFGVRGLESNQDYLYIDKEGRLHDARQEADTYLALEKMNAIAREGLVSSEYINYGRLTSSNYLESDTGFMSYDYSQTQSIYNETRLNNSLGEKYAPVLIPIAKWNDGDRTDYFRFSESCRTVGSDGWAISKLGVGSDTNKLNALLKLIDYAYSYEGQILMTFGPDEFLDVKNATAADIADKYNTYLGLGHMPKISQATEFELWDKCGGNYTNYARFYIGSLLSFNVSQSFEIQCTQHVGREGFEKIIYSLMAGTISYPNHWVNEENMWYTSVPTVLPTTNAENVELNSYIELTSNGMFSKSKDRANLLTDFISGGYAAFN